jgi:hypothetical protein
VSTPLRALMLALMIACAFAGVGAGVRRQVAGETVPSFIVPIESQPRGASDLPN